MSRCFLTQRQINKHKKEQASKELHNLSKNIEKYGLIMITSHVEILNIQNREETAPEFCISKITFNPFIRFYGLFLEKLRV